MSLDLESGLVRHLIHPLWARRDHRTYAKYLAEFAKSQFLSPERLKELQRVRVSRLLNHAYEHCAFYRCRIEQAVLKPRDFDDLASLEALPPLTKTDIQRNMSGLQADNVPENERYRNQTGGSTGAPLQFYVDKERLDSRMASTVRHDSWAG